MDDRKNSELALHNDGEEDDAEEYEFIKICAIFIASLNTFLCVKGKGKEVNKVDTMGLK